MTLVAFPRLMNIKNRAVDILSKSFRDNQSVRYVVKNDSKLDKRINALMGYSYDMCSRFGEVLMSEDENGCALLLWSDKKKTVPYWDAKLALNAIGLNRVLKVLKRESMIKNQHPEEPFLYLWFIGVYPQYQKQGTGTKLLRKVVELSEKKDLPIYLETSMSQNLPWYEKHNFRIYGELDFGHTLYLLQKSAT